MSDDDARYDASGQQDTSGHFTNHDQAREQWYASDYVRERQSRSANLSKEGRTNGSRGAHEGGPSRLVVGLLVLAGLGYWAWSTYRTLPYEFLSDAGKAERLQGLEEILAARKSAQSERDRRVKDLVEQLHADLNSGRFDAHKYFEPRVTQFAKFANVTPIQINESVQQVLPKVSQGCQLSAESVRADGIEQYSFIEAAKCGKPKGVPYIVRTLVQVRVAFEGKLTFYDRVRVLPGGSEHEQAAKRPSNGGASRPRADSNR